MSGQREKLIGELIGLARATDGNEHLISASSNETVAACLASRDENQIPELLKRVEEEKRKMVPDCFFCANPCGRTERYDLGKLQELEPEMREIRLELLAAVEKIAGGQIPEAAYPLFYHALVAIGMEDLTVEDIRPLLQQIQALL